MDEIKAAYQSKTFERVRTGITGLDEILNGGLPKGRPTCYAVDRVAARPY